MYFSDENGRRIDSIRTAIEEWKSKELIEDLEYYILITCLIESVSFYANIAGVYAAFHKKWDPRAVKPLQLRTIQIYQSEKEHRVYNCDSLEILGEVDTDILYLDPPYNARQYLPNYHLVETIATYDEPIIRGVSGLRADKDKKSTFCNAKTALRDLQRVTQEAKYRYLVLSYNSEGIMKHEDIVDVLSQYGKVAFEEFEYLRFKSNNNGLSKTRKHINERIYILTR